MIITQKIKIFCLLSVLVLLGFVFAQGLPPRQALEKQSIRDTSTATLVVDQIRIPLNVKPDTSLFQALVEAEKSGVIQFSGKEYPSLGFFVTEIGALSSRKGNLVYYVNGAMASQGVSSYLLKPGDLIEWKLEENR